MVSASAAAMAAMASPLLEAGAIDGARAILINITGSSNLSLHEFNEACSIIRDAADCDEAQINFGVIANDAMGDAVKITVIATGFRGHAAPVEVFIARPAAPPSHEWFPVPEQIPAPAPEPVLDMQQPEPAASVLFDDDLDTPAYLRQAKLLN